MPTWADVASPLMPPGGPPPLSFVAMDPAAHFVSPEMSGCLLGVNMTRIDLCTSPHKLDGPVASTVSGNPIHPVGNPDLEESSQLCLPSDPQPVHHQVCVSVEWKPSRHLHCPGPSCQQLLWATRQPPETAPSACPKPALHTAPVKPPLKQTSEHATALLTASGGPPVRST